MCSMIVIQRSTSLPYFCFICKKNKTMKFTFTFYIYAFSRRFYPKRLTLHSSYSFTFDQLLLSLGIEPMILALLAPCSTTWATGNWHQFINFTISFDWLRNWVLHVISNCLLFHKVYVWGLKYHSLLCKNIINAILTYFLRGFMFQSVNYSSRLSGMTFKNINTLFWLKSIGRWKFMLMKYHTSDKMFEMMSSQSSDNIKIANGTD